MANDIDSYLIEVNYYGRFFKENDCIKEYVGLVDYFEVKSDFTYKDLIEKVRTGYDYKDGDMLYYKAAMDDFKTGLVLIEDERSWIRIFGKQIPNVVISIYVEKPTDSTGDFVEFAGITFEAAAFPQGVSTVQGGGLGGNGSGLQVQDEIVEDEHQQNSEDASYQPNSEDESDQDDEFWEESVLLESVVPEPNRFTPTEQTTSDVGVNLREELVSEDELLTPPGSDDEPGVERQRFAQYNPRRCADGPQLKLGMMFPNATVLQDVLADHSVANNYSIHWILNKWNKMSAECMAKCGWKLYASALENEKTVQIKTYQPVHRCGRAHKSRQCSAKWIARTYLSMFKDQPLKVQTIQSDLMRKHDFEVTRFTIARAIKMMKAEIDGTLTKMWSFQHFQERR